MEVRRAYFEAPRWGIAWLAAVCALLFGGCQTASMFSGGDGAVLCRCETLGTEARRLFEMACDAEQDDLPCAVDLYFRAALAGWPWVLTGDGGTLSAAEASHIYHTSVAAWIEQSQRHGRFRGDERFLVNLSYGRTVVPLACLGLPWQSCDVDELVVVEEPGRNSKLTNYHACTGFGVPVVGVRRAGKRTHPQDRFFNEQMPYAATAVLRPSSSDPTQAVLELYDPLEVHTVEIDGQSVSMARDISAPLDYQLAHSENTGMLGFVHPDVPEEAEGLRFVEPYQRGKIPVVFIHGLLSDPSTWFDTANDLRCDAWFNERYQIWAFRYASGKPFVTTATYLRTQLRNAVQVLDPQGCDPALQQMVLIGHSMGGLIAKLQVTESEERIWQSFATVPFEALQGGGQVRARLAEGCFFQPQPFVRRVIFIATPHGGSSYATRGIGRIGSAIVKPAPLTTEAHEALVEANPGAFSSQFERRVPTSIDLLEPDDPTLMAIRTLRVSPHVQLHSIIGTGRYMLTEGVGDGAVAVESALHPGVVSQRFVETTHTEIQRHPDTLAELRHILFTHMQTAAGTVQSMRTAGGPEIR